MNKKIICIMGMHRSGTSLTAAAVHTLGINFGGNLMPAAKDNPKGFFEDIEMVALNDNLLAALNCNWRDIDRLNLSPDLNLLKDFYPKARKLLHNKFNTQDTFAFKDPRTCLLLAFWRPLFHELGIETRYIISIRHPASIAESLHVRDNIGKDQAYKLTLLYNFRAIADGCTDPFLILDYDNTLVSAADTLYRIHRFIGNETKDIQGKMNKFAAHTEFGLRHHSNRIYSIPEPLSERLYRLLYADVIGTTRAFSKSFMPTWREISSKIIRGEF